MTEPIDSPQLPSGDDRRTPLLVCAPLRVEARAVRRGLRDSARAAGTTGRDGAGDAASVVRTGYGTTRAANRAAEVEHIPFGMMAITGTGAGLIPDRPGPACS